jgi:exopolysaccharide production protein ExoZ
MERRKRSNTFTAAAAPYGALDAWRGVACIAVVLRHAELISLGKFPVVCSTAFARIVSYGYLGVQVFFVISGFCIMTAAVSTVRNHRSAFSFVTARIRRIYPPYLLALPLGFLLNFGGIYLITHHILSHGTQQYIDVTHQPPTFYLSNLTLTQAAFHQPFLLDVAWTLGYEVAFYGIVALLLFALRGASIEYFFVILDALTIGCLAWACKAGPENLPFPLDLWPQFGLGIIAYELLCKRDRFVMLRAVAIYCAVGLLLAVSRHAAPIPGALAAKNPLLGFSAAAAFSLVIVALRPLDQRLTRTGPVAAFAWFGAFSYSIYLVHLPLEFVAFTLLKQAHVPGSMPFVWVYWLVIISACLAASRIFFLYCERPWMRGGTRPAMADPEVNPQPATQAAYA